MTGCGLLLQRVEDSCLCLSGQLLWLVLCFPWGEVKTQPPAAIALTLLPSIPLTFLH